MESLINERPAAHPTTNNPTPTPSKNLSDFIPIFVGISCIIFFSLVGGLLIWLTLLVLPTINELSSYTVTSATVDPFIISSKKLTAAWNISIHIKTLNYNLDFDRAQSSIYYGSDLLSHVSIHKFEVPRFEGKTIHACLMNHSESLDVDVADSMIRDRLLRGAVDFRVELLGRGRFLGVFDSGFKFSISCENVTVGFPATHDVGPGVMLGPPRKCIVLVDGKANNKG